MGGNKKVEIMQTQEPSIAYALRDGEDITVEYNENACCIRTKILGNEHLNIFKTRKEALDFELDLEKLLDLCEHNIRLLKNKEDLINIYEKRISTLFGKYAKN